MPDYSGQADIRGINVDKLAKGFAEEEIFMRNHVTVNSTSAREVRWYQKTAGFLTATSPANIQVAPLAKPFILDPTYTRNTSYVLKFMAESPLISTEDIKDSDPDVWGGILRDVVRAVSYKEAQHIYGVITENNTVVNINTNAAGAVWSTPGSANCIEDIMEAKLNIRNYSYDPEGAILMLHPNEYKDLMDYLINTKGSSIPAFSSERIRDGVVMEILGLRVVVSTIVTTNTAVVFIPQKSATLKEFMPLTTAVITEDLIGSKFRCAVESVCLLTDPRSVNLITGM